MGISAVDLHSNLIQFRQFFAFLFDPLFTINLMSINNYSEFYWVSYLCKMWAKLGCKLTPKLSGNCNSTVNQLFARLTYTFPGWRSAVSGDIEEWTKKYKMEMLRQFINSGIKDAEAIDRAISKLGSVLHSITNSR
jgi:hypothetical protein